VIDKGPRPASIRRPTPRGPEAGRRGEYVGPGLVGIRSIYDESGEHACAAPARPQVAGSVGGCYDPPAATVRRKMPSRAFFPPHHPWTRGRSRATDPRRDPVVDGSSLRDVPQFRKQPREDCSTLTSGIVGHALACRLWPETARKSVPYEGSKPPCPDQGRRPELPGLIGGASIRPSNRGRGRSVLLLSVSLYGWTGIVAGAPGGPPAGLSPPQPE
jgi:hypothetical protein